MGLFEQFPYTNFHNLNLDWLINEIKNLGNQAVLSVNGMTGDVVLYKSENIVFPEVEADTWRMVRIADGHTAGVMFQNGLMYVMFDNASERVYTVEHPPTFPVTSVNGQTGAVELYQEAGVRLPDVTDEYTNIRRQIQTNGVDNIVGIEVKADKAYRMKDTQRAEIYDAMNQPPYPVTSVNGQTGAIMLAIPFANVNVDDVMFTQAAAGHEWSIGRETPDGTASIQIRTDASKAEAWIDFFTDGTPQATYTKKLLTTDDIPSGSGVVSINGLSGVVTLTGSDIKRNSSSQDSVEDVLIGLEADLGDAQDDIDDLQGDMTTAQGNITALQNTVSGLSGGTGLAYIVTGDTANAAVPAGAYAYIKNNTHSLADGYYQNTSASSFPVSGGTADSTVFTAVSTEGVLNELNDKLGQPTSGFFTASAGSYIGENRSILIGNNVLLDVWVRKDSGGYPQDTWTEVGTITGHSFTNGMLFPTAQNGVSVIGRIEITAAGKVNFNPGIFSTGSGSTSNGCRIFALIPLE